MSKPDFSCFEEEPAPNDPTGGNKFCPLASAQPRPPAWGAWLQQGLLATGSRQIPNSWLCGPAPSSYVPITSKPFPHNHNHMLVEHWRTLVSTYLSHVALKNPQVAPRSATYHSIDGDLHSGNSPAPSNPASHFPPTLVDFGFWILGSLPWILDLLPPKT